MIYNQFLTITSQKLWSRNVKGKHTTTGALGDHGDRTDHRYCVRDGLLAAGGGLRGHAVFVYQRRQLGSVG